MNHRYNLEVSDVLKNCQEELAQRYKFHSVQYKALEDITSCRTSQRGGHKHICFNCGYHKVSYNSCRNRHCPKCQFLKQIQWVDKLKSRMLPCRYFHVVFTIPQQLNKLFYLNQTACYNLLFKASWEALKTAGKNPLYLGAKLGAISVLHTWGQTLTYHPHVHILVPAGGLSEDNVEWITTRKNFLLPVKVLSALFRGIMYKGLLALLDKEDITVPGDFPDKNALKKQLYRKSWNVYAKKTFGAAEGVLQYLGRYTHRVGISNNRMISLEAKTVRFGYKDYRGGNKKKIMELSDFEFSRRFLQHILPSGFYKIRYYGILATALIDTDRQEVTALICKSVVLSSLEGLTAYEIIRALFEKDPLKCPNCKQGFLRHIKEFVPLE